MRFFFVDKMKAVSTLKDTCAAPRASLHEAAVSLVRIDRLSSWSGL